MSVEADALASLAAINIQDEKFETVVIKSSDVVMTAKFNQLYRDKIMGKLEICVLLTCEKGFVIEKKSMAGGHAFTNSIQHFVSELLCSTFWSSPSSADILPLVAFASRIDAASQTAVATISENDDWTAPNASLARANSSAPKVGSRFSGNWKGRTASRKSQGTCGWGYAYPVLDVLCCRYRLAPTSRSVLPVSRVVPSVRVSRSPVSLCKRVSVCAAIGSCDCAHSLHGD